MKSPITGKEMMLLKEPREMEFRKERVEIIYHFFLCEESGEQFTTTSLDELNMNQVYNQYRDLLNIPFPEEIIRIREKYGASAGKMSEILGFGINGYRQYEAGEMPSSSNAKLIQLAANPKNFLEMVSLCDSLEVKYKKKYIEKAEQLIEENSKNKFNLNLEEYFLGNPLADIYSGYKTPNFDKFSEMVIFFAERMEPFKTKLNKLLFFADFLMFKQSCFSISGVRYKAIQLGPVPNNFNSIYEYLANNQIIDINYTNYPNGYSGEQFKAKKERPFDETKFTEAELQLLEEVSQRFKEVSTTEIIEISHLEEAWKQNQNDKKVISYRFAFELTQI